MNKTSVHIQKLVLSALCIALCYVLPFITGNIPRFGKALSPMHIPVFLCAYLCGPFWAAAVGFISPIFRSLTIGAPPLLGALAMCFELAAYGLCAAFIHKLLPRKAWALYASLLISMVAGRIVSVLAKIVIFGIAGNPVMVGAFITEAFVDTLPGAALHILLIPLIVMALYQALPWLKKSK